MRWFLLLILFVSACWVTSCAPKASPVVRPQLAKLVCEKFCAGQTYSLQSEFNGQAARRFVCTCHDLTQKEVFE